MVLKNGKVLIYDGSKSEIYDPNTNSFTPIKDTNKNKGSTTILLNNGDVLIAGGWNKELERFKYDLLIKAYRSY